MNKYSARRHGWIRANGTKITERIRVAPHGTFPDYPSADAPRDVSLARAQVRAEGRWADDVFAVPRSSVWPLSSALICVLLLSLGLWAGIWLAVAAVSAWIAPFL